jgi:polyisoprenoid-binding protein YceI
VVTLVALAAIVPAACAQGTAYTLDPTHTFASFEVLHEGVSYVRARWDRKEGSVQLDRAARSGRIEIRIDMASVSSGSPALDAALRGKDFFDAEQYPQALFASDAFAFEGDRLTAVQGTLTLRGRSAPLVLHARRFNCYTSPLFRREVCGGDFEATLSRGAWGIGPPGGAADSVRLIVQVEAVRSS